MDKYQRYFQEKIGSSYEYHSTQVDLADDGLDKYIGFQDILDFIPDEHLYIEENDYGKETDPHITVFYGLLNDDYEALKSILEGFGSIAVETGTIQKFSSEKYDVIYIECVSPQLEDIHYFIRDHFDNANDKPYKAHITLAYVQPGTCDFMIGNAIAEGTEIYFHKVKWCHKDGRKLEMSLV